MKSVAELARKAGFDVDSMGQIYPMDDESCSDNIERLLALHKAEVIKELCADEEPVYQLRYTDGRFPAYWTELTELDYQHRDPREGCEFRILYPASTVAALKARVAELEKDAERLDWLNENFYNREKNDWDATVYKDSTQWVFFAPEGVQGDIRVVLDEALRSKK